MKKWAHIFIWLSFAIVTLHNVVPHHHLSDHLFNTEPRSSYTEAEEESSVFTFLEHFFHADTGIDHNKQIKNSPIPHINWDFAYVAIAFFTCFFCLLTIEKQSYGAPQNEVAHQLHLQQIPVLRGPPHA